MKRLLAVLLMMTMVTSGCGGSDTPAAEEATAGEGVLDAVEEEAIEAEGDLGEMIEAMEALEEVADAVDDMTDVGPSGPTVGCGEAFVQGDFSYSVIGARKEQADDMDLLILTMELLNRGEENESFSPLMSMELMDAKGNQGDFQMMGDFYTMDILVGTVMGGGNKIVGEVAFDVSETTDTTYILKIGSVMAYVDAITITEADLGQTWGEVFESKGIEASYSLGDRVDFNGQEITINAARVVPVDTYSSGKEMPGMMLLEIDMTGVNNGTEDFSFTTVGWSTSVRKVMLTDGTELECDYNCYSNNFPVSPGETRDETFAVFFPEGEKEFIVALQTDIGEQEVMELVSVTVE